MNKSLRHTSRNHDLKIKKEGVRVATVDVVGKG